MQVSDYPVGQQNRVRQAPKRARYDREFVHGVLDEGYVAHVSFIHEELPMIIPLYYVREGETLLLHGSRKARVIPIRISIDLCHREEQVRQGGARCAVVLVP